MCCKYVYAYHKVKTSSCSSQDIEIFKRSTRKGILYTCHGHLKMEACMDDDLTVSKTDIRSAMDTTCLLVVIWFLQRTRNKLLLLD